jgi:transcriptional regulator with XRE-family HTH domain
MKLSDWLSREGLTALAFASRIERSHTTIGRLLKGETRPDWETLQRIHAATGGEVTANDFLHPTDARAA